MKEDISIDEFDGKKFKITFFEEDDNRKAVVTHYLHNYYNGEKNTFRANYVTTIKSNYAQRIANHAFAHPVRVGVDFVKK